MIEKGKDQETKATNALRFDILCLFPKESRTISVIKRPVGQQDVVTKNKSVEWLEFDKGFAERKFIVPLSSFVENLRVMKIRRLIVTEKT